MGRFVHAAVALLVLFETTIACTTWTRYGNVPGSARATAFRCSLTWEKVQPSGDVYMSTAISLGRGAGGPCADGYFGAQFHYSGQPTLLFSMASKQPIQAFPVGPYCKKEYFDFAGPQNGVQCTRFANLQIGLQYNFVMHMVMQTKNGAMWEVAVEDDNGQKLYEIGRVFIVDAPLGLDTERCRTLEFSSFSRQEYYAGFKQFTSSARWSRYSFIGSMIPTGGYGYCNEHPLFEFESGISWSQCKNLCYYEPTCSYSSSNGKQCKLFRTCTEQHLGEVGQKLAKTKMIALNGTGYCTGYPLVQHKTNISLLQCNELCAQTMDCNFASYSHKDVLYSPVDGTHCMLFSKCDHMADYLKDLWTTSEKSTNLDRLDELWITPDPDASMAPMDGQGYCNGLLVGSRKQISLAQCELLCLKDISCRFASYSSKDFRYSTDGTHCMLYSNCNGRSDYNKELWTTSKKSADIDIADNLWITAKKTTDCFELMNSSPTDSRGFCDGMPIANFKNNVSLAQCQEHCASNAKCNYASYSSGDHWYTSDGTHCMLYGDCNSLASYLAHVWLTYKKRATCSSGTQVVYPATGADSCCIHLPEGQQEAEVISSKPLSIRFSAGPNISVACKKDRRLLLI